jgi:AraC-like DNA-binding protein
VFLGGKNLFQTFNHNHQYTSGDIAVSTHWLRLLLQGFEAGGLDAKHILECAGLNQNSLNHPSGRSDLEQTLKVWRAAESLSDRPVGLMLGEYLTPLHFPILAVNLMSCPNVLSALQLGSRYSNIISQGGHITMVAAADGVAIRYMPAKDGFSRHQIDTVLLLLKRFSEWLTCRVITPKRVHLVCDQPVASEYEEYARHYGVVPTFGMPFNELVIGASWLSYALPGGEPLLMDFHKSLIDEKMEHILAPSAIVRVQNELRQAVHLKVDRSGMAKLLNMSASTLHRRLKEAGTSFNELLEKERIRRSTQLVLGTQLPLADISELLGFSESSAFSKAFKRWHGESPQIFRQRNIQNNSAF